MSYLLGKRNANGWLTLGHEPLNPDAAVNGHDGTVGSRARKRRRTESLPRTKMSSNSPASRRVSLRKTQSPASRHTSPQNRRAQVARTRRKPQRYSDGNNAENGEDEDMSDDNDQSGRGSRSMVPREKSKQISQSQEPLALPVVPPRLQLKSSPLENDPPQQPTGSAGPFNVHGHAHMQTGSNIIDLSNSYISGAPLEVKKQNLQKLDDLVGYPCPLVSKFALR